MYPAGKNEYVWPEKGDEYHYPVENIVCKIEPPVTTRNELCDCFVIPKWMAICYIKSTDFTILCGCLLALSIHNITKNLGST